MVNVPNLMQNLTSLKIKNIAFNEVIHSGNDVGDHIKMAMEDIRGLEIFLEKIMSASIFCLLKNYTHSFPQCIGLACLLFASRHGI